MSNNRNRLPIFIAGSILVGAVMIGLAFGGNGMLLDGANRAPALVATPDKVAIGDKYVLSGTNFKAYPHIILTFSDGEPNVYIGVKPNGTFSHSHIMPTDRSLIGTKLVISAFADAGNGTLGALLAQLKG